jgi:hypothetical protein
VADSGVGETVKHKDRQWVNGDLEVAVDSGGVFRHATFALKYWTDFSLKFVQYLHTKFQYLSAAMLQSNIGNHLK